MKIIAVGDTHGRPYWAHIADHLEFDKLILMGDYFDSKEDISPELQIANFHDILNFKKQNLNKVILLFGNHDYHYLSVVDQIYSGYMQEYYQPIQELLEHAINENLMQMCYVSEGFLYSHAGITKRWVNQNDINVNNIETDVNQLFKNSPNAFKFTIGENANSEGDDVCQSPIWVRPKSLLKDMIEGFTQVAGHTPQRELTVTKSAIFIDTLGSTQEYLIINNGTCSIQTIPLLYSK